MSLIQDVKNRYGNEALQYIPQIASKEIGRVVLKRKLDTTKHQAREMIKLVRDHPEADMWAKLAKDDSFQESFPMLVEHCEEIGMPVSSVKHFWHKTNHFSIFSKPTTPSNKQLYQVFDDIVERHATGEYKPFDHVEVDTKRALKATVTDAHVGLDPDPEDNGLFKYEYGPDQYKDSMERLFQSIMKEYNTYGTFDLLLLDDLGDREDGWDGLTTRGGHDLPQNMRNADVFSLCVDTTVSLIRGLVSEGVANKFILRNCTNANHSSDFAEIINRAVKKIVGLTYHEDLVEVQSLNRFMEHRFYGDHCFILTHGKDKKEMKRGLPLDLDDKTVKYVRDYIDFYNLEKKADYIHLEKGDLHQIGYHKDNRFDYRNFMSFSPPSNWEQHNFGDSYAGYSIQVIPKHDNEISHTDYFLNYKKNNATKY